MDEVAHDFGIVDGADAGDRESFGYFGAARLFLQKGEKRGCVEDNPTHSPLSARRLARKASTEASGLSAVYFRASA